MAQTVLCLTEECATKIACGITTDLQIGKALMMAEAGHVVRLDDARLLLNEWAAL